MWSAWVMVLGCGGSDEVPPPDDTEQVAEETADTGVVEGTASLLLAPPGVSTPEGPVHLVRRLTVATSEPTTLALVLDDGRSVRDVVFDTLATEHDVPLLGLRAGVTHRVTVVVSTAEGASDEATVEVEVAPPDVLLPDVELLSGDPAAAPGYTLMAGWAPDRQDTLLAVDGHGDVVWVYEPRSEPKAAHLWPDGTVSSVVDHSVLVHRMDGTFVTLYTNRPVEGATEIPDRVHHDAVFPGDGTLWTLRSQAVAVDAFPVDEATPDELAAATLMDDRVLHLALDGTVLDEWAMSDLLDTERIGFGSTAEVGAGLDWTHANAVVPTDGGFLISLRHQDAVVKVDAATSEVAWILANPDGWSADLEAKRLQPVGEASWPYHQHGVKVDGDRLFVFDNGNGHRTTPYSLDPHPDGNFSRLAGWRIDEEAGTVELIADLVDPAEPMYSRALGNVQVLDGDRLLGTYAYLLRELGVDNDALGRGSQSVRLRQWDLSTSEVVWDLSLSLPVDVSPRGWVSDRATRVPSLYLGIAEESWR